ncbi:MAG: glycosyltransferase family 4 protein [Bacteroidota bacterium]
MDVKIVQVGKSGFPVVPAAPIERIRLYGKGMVAQGEPVLVLNRKGVLTASQKKDEVPPSGVNDGIYYHFVSDSVFRPSSFLRRNIKKIQGLFKEMGFLRKAKKAKATGYLIVHSMGFGNMLLYRMVASVLNYKFIYQIVEWNAALTSRKKLKNRISDFFFERIGLRLADAYLPISHFLADTLKERYPDKPQLYVPIICDFSRFEGISIAKKEEYFLYCGSLSYAEVVHFIMEAYAKLKTENTFLYLVLSGDREKIADIQERAQELGIAEKIRIFSRIPYQELVEKYCGAKALLIPLRPTLQDTARFPHKIGEYLASGNPIVTTNYGEITHHFQQGETAFIADEYEVSAYAEQMQYILDQPELAKQVGTAGKRYGLDHFDCNVHGRRMLTFFQELSGEAFENFDENAPLQKEPALLAKP